MATQPLQYAPWTSDVELGFYSALANIKINHDKLDSSSRKVLGLYAIEHRDAPERSTRMEIHANALTADNTPVGHYRAEGSIRNFNTLEEFRQVDKTAHIERAGRTIWEAIKDGTIYSCPSLLSSFSAICFADLKKYKFTYHFAYPCLHSDPQWRLVTSEGGSSEDAMHKLGQRETQTLVEAVQTWRYSVDARQHGFFLAKRVRKEVVEAQWRSGSGEIEEEEEDGNINPAVQRRRKSRTHSLSELGFLWVVAPLANFEQGFFDNAEADDRFVCFVDPSTYQTNPGWMLRNLLVLVRQRWKLDEVQVLAYRDVHARRDFPTSRFFRLQSATPVFQKKAHVLPPLSASSALRPDQVDASGELIETQSADTQQASAKAEPDDVSQIIPRITGWERNDQNKLISRIVDLAAYMDPTKLADQAVDLNLKLIKWRISPSIDLDAIKHTSCLLLGAGTLGSYVARALMGWGVRKISFIDNAKVSYSNPVRQPLYNFKDCEGGGVQKAQRAAQALSEIYPGIHAAGHVMSVPMAGHPIMDESRVKREYETLRDLIDQHDAIFLLMDTRESRWLPTVMAKASGKIVINAALGFDTYVVMRHGLEHKTGDTRTGQLPELGCYFCSDVVAPADSLKSATLDQQCTVTRPGAAPLASALAVEMLVSIVQHRDKGHAPAPNPHVTGSANTIQPAPPTDASLPDSHPLGTVPHQLRGYMSTWQTIQVRGQAYDCCAACSPNIIKAYRDGGWDFVKKAVNEKGYVEEVSGLAEVQRRAEELDQEIDDWDDNDDEEAEII